MIRADGSHLAELLLTDYLWKAGIVAVVVILAIVAATLIWKRIR